MPITFTLEDDLLTALYARSEREGRPVEAVVTDFVRRGLAERPAATAGLRWYPPGDIRNDWHLFPLRPEEPPVTTELIRRLRDEPE